MPDVGVPGAVSGSRERQAIVARATRVDDLPALREPARTGDLESGGEKIDILVTDVVMPGLNGIDLAARVRERRPDLGVVFISGNTDGVVVRDSELRAVGTLVAKPFTAHDLGQAVGRACGDPRSLARSGAKDAAKDAPAA